MDLERYFSEYRKNIIGYDHFFSTPYGEKKLVYADWIGSGRLYLPIEKQLIEKIGPFVGNTHTEASENGRRMTAAYQLAHKKIKDHVNAGSREVLLTTGFGMTGAIVKFQRILGLKTCILGKECSTRKNRDRPVVFITHMEHHSNHTSWYETDTDVVVLEPGNDLAVDPSKLEDALKKYRDRKVKIGSFTACSNVTGIRPPYRDLARLMHEYNGLAFIDFAASAPYDPMDMNPANPLEKLDAIFFSPHKFLGGPGSSGVLVFDSSLYPNGPPDQPGGGTVYWTNPWGEYKFIDDIEIREDGGTPGFLQAIRTALSIGLKEQMGTDMMRLRENELVRLAFKEFSSVPGLHLLAEKNTERLGVMSFYIEGIHYNLVVTLLSDRFGIQARGGCACAGTYGHYLLDVSYEKSKKITEKINSGDLSEKPGWIRISLHPTMTCDEVAFIAGALKEIVLHHTKWAEDYEYIKYTNEFRNKNTNKRMENISSWLTL